MSNQPIGKISVKKFSFALREIASVVVSEEEFTWLCDRLEELQPYLHKRNPVDSGCPQCEPSRSSKSDVDQIREQKYIPMMTRGENTNIFYERYGVDTSYMIIIVRDKGIELAAIHLNPFEKCPSC